MAPFFREGWLVGAKPLSDFETEGGQEGKKKGRGGKRGSRVEEKKEEMETK